MIRLIIAFLFLALLQVHCFAGIPPFSNAPGGQAHKYVICSNTQSSGANGGTATSGSWSAITLNTKDVDTGSIASLSSNQITLPAGTYIVHANSPFFATSTSQSRLYNVTDSAVEHIGSECYTSHTSSVSTSSSLFYVLTIASTKVFEFQYRVATTESNDGLGVAAGFGTSEVYAQIYFEKI